MNINPFLQPPSLIPPLSVQSRHARSINDSSAPQKKWSGEESEPESKKTGVEQKPIATSSPDPELEARTTTIYGSTTVSAPNANYTLTQREQRIDGYANRVNTQIGQIENGSEGERNIKFQRARQFMEPAGYFSGGLLSAGYDPHEKFTVTFSSYTGKGKPETLTNTQKRTYFAWEIAAGSLAHDKVQRGGPINFQEMEIASGDRGKINNLESVGQTLQDHWENEIASSMRDASGTLAKRSGKADAYVLKGTLQSLSNDSESFKLLSPEAQTAIKRTLEQNGQVIVPNIYGYPMAGYAFIPYTPYDGNYEHRPNKGVMVDLKNGAAHEIKGDDDFANWAKSNRDNLQKSFNARDRQGGIDAHWPKAGEVLDNLIEGNHANYPGYQNLVKDQAIPVREVFNYTRSRGSDYHLKYGNLNDSIATSYQDLNAKNAVWSDQTQVFGSSQQGWKGAKDFWGNTFGYVPVLGNVGIIAFGIHDGIYGMTAQDRVGGNAAAVISSLQLAHELTPIGIEAGLGENTGTAAIGLNYNWRYNAATSDFELVRAPELPSTANQAPVSMGGAPEVNVNPAPPPSASFPGMQEVEFNGRKYFASNTPDAGDGAHYILRVQHPEDPSKLANSGIIAKPDEAGVWKNKGDAGHPQLPPGDDAQNGIPPINRLRPSQSGDISKYALPNGEKLIENAVPNTKGIYQATDEKRWFIRYADDTGLQKVYEIRSDFKLSDNYVQIIDPNTRKPVLTVYANGDGQWSTARGQGGWPWNRAPSSPPTEAAKIPPKLSDGFEALGDPKTSGADKFDEVFNYNNDTTYQQSVSNYKEGDVLKRKLNISWTVDEDNFEVYSSEKSQPNEYSTTPYSPNFLKDLNRDHYSVRIKQPDGYTTVELDASGSADGETLRQRLKQFEEAIPDPLLRSRISEVAHQGSVAPTSVELKMNQLQEHVGFKGKDTHYIITYDPETNTAKVQFDAKMTLLDLDKDAAEIPNMEVSAQRTFEIAESNELDPDANPYAINKKAPFTLTASSIVEVK